MSKLLEEAIADAKAVRATALANAKAALEEAFLPQAQAMLSQKLKLEAGMEEEIPTDVSQEEPVVAETVGDIEKAGAKLTGPNHPKLKSAKAQDKMKKQETEKWLEETEIGSDPVNANEIPGELGGSDVINTDDDKSISDTELEEILAELGGDLEEEGETPQAAQAPVPAPAPEIPMDQAPAPAPSPAPAPENPIAQVPTPPPAPVSEEDMQEIDLNELLASLNESEEEEEEEEKEEKKEDDKECYDEVIKERNDAVAAVNHYKSQLNELNLLNAKLLYTNKLFKNYGLTNEQKMKIVETFDLTQTVREVKIAYTSLAESFNFGKSTVKKTNTVAKTITEGLASKTVASTKPAKSLIVENTNAQALRFQTLAGIKKA